MDKKYTVTFDLSRFAVKKLPDNSVNSILYVLTLFRIHLLLSIFLRILFHTSETSKLRGAHPQLNGYPVHLNDRMQTFGIQNFLNIYDYRE